MPPEVLEIFILCKKGMNTRIQIEMLKKIIQPWSIDVWSFGAVLIEILTGIPHWLTYKCRVIRN